MDDFDLDRFVTAQAPVYASALAELRAGNKRGHWIWYVFPQMRGLGASYNSTYYGISSLEEARAYLAHPLLGPRLRECTQVLLVHAGRSAETILGGIDAVKLCSSMTLFALAGGPGEPFRRCLDAFCRGEDENTLRLLA